MTVYLVKARGSKPEAMNDDEKASFAYEVSDGGVLRVLTAEATELKWSVIREYGPQGWVEVSGTRYTSDTEKLAGFSGKAAHKASRAQVL